MKTITAFVLALALLVTPAAFAQHGRGNSHGHDNSHGRGNGGARSGRDGHFNRDRHGRIDRNRNVRIVGGRREVFFDGFWFGCDVWPEWVFASDVYVITVDDGYVMYSYADPSLSISINLVP